MNPLCDPSTFEETDEGFRGINPPIWGTLAFNHYRQDHGRFPGPLVHNFMILVIGAHLHYLINILSIFSGRKGIPTYISTRIEKNERKYASNDKVLFITICHIPLLHFIPIHTYLFSKSSWLSSHLVWMTPMMHLKRT